MHSLPLSKLINLSSEWKGGWLKNLYSQLIILEFSFYINEFKFVYEVCIIK